MSKTPRGYESGVPDDVGRKARGLARRDWPIRRYRLGEEPSDDLSAAATPGQLVAMVWPLTVLSWRLAGLDMPGYERRHAPGAVRRSRGAA